MSNCIIVQSGGPTAVINNSIVGLLDEIDVSTYKGKVYGANSGIKGLIEGDYVNLKKLSFEERYRLRWTPGAALGTCRHKVTDKDLVKIFNNFIKHNIRFVFYIGGNGSMQVAKMLNDYADRANYEITVIGIPKSIDNDLLKTDHSPGYGSAAKFLASSILEMKMDVASYQKDSRITIIETMGRHTGWLAAACSLTINKNDDCRTMIHLPEVPFNLANCLKEIEKAYKMRQDVFLIVSEGIKNEEGKLINESTVSYDMLDRPKLGGVSNFIKEKIDEHIGANVRKISPSIWQRSSILLASKTDVNEAYQIGREAWKFAKQGYSDIMVTMKREETEDSKYKIKYSFTNLENVANKEKTIPVNWYDDKNYIMKKQFINYIEPLIKGEMIIPMEKGLPTYQVI